MTAIQNITATLAVALMMWFAKYRKLRGDYACPSCGSKNGKHDPTCQWKRFYEDE